MGNRSGQYENKMSQPEDRVKAGELRRPDALKTTTKNK